MKTTSLITYNTRRSLSFIIAGIILSFVLYSFAIASTTVSIADSSVTSRSIQELRTEVSELESKYYMMIDELSIEQAVEEGFVKDERAVFAHVNQSTVVAYNY